MLLVKYILIKLRKATAAMDAMDKTPISFQAHIRTNKLFEVLIDDAHEAGLDKDD